MKSNIFTITIAALFIAAALALIALAAADENAKRGSPPGVGGGESDVLSADIERFSFGSISMAAGKVSYLYRVKNKSAAPVTVTKLYTSCMCTTAALKKGETVLGPFGMPAHGVRIPVIDEVIAPGEEFTVEAVFDPAAHGPAGLGRIQRTVILENSAGKPFELEFDALVMP